jgi:hypothetical protein
MADTWRAVTVPCQQLGAGPEIVDREVLAEHPWVAEEALHKVVTVLKRELAERGWQPVEDIKTWVEEIPTCNQLAYYASVWAADAWEDGTWTSVRAAVAEDQAILQRGAH